jgi:hydrogenase/urease accessory protein HupE
VTRALHSLAPGFVAILLSGLAAAHEIRPAYLEIREHSAERLDIVWKQPVVGDVALPLHPSLSSGWLDPARAVATYSDTYMIRRWTVAAALSSLEGQRLSIEGLQATLTDVLVRIAPTNGRDVIHLIKPDRPAWAVPSLSKATAGVPHYFSLGVEHIWAGIDHLLFVLGLLLLAPRFRDLLKTITAFTVAHSITLAAAALELVHAPTAPMEAVIALSIMFLAVELVQLRRGRPGLASRHTWLVALTLGLLHGLGFAAALSEVGLPEERIALALLLFNIGIEAGQIVFVCCALLALRMLAAAVPYISDRIRWAMPHVIGSLAGFWFVERTLAALA